MLVLTIRAAIRILLPALLSALLLSALVLGDGAAAAGASGPGGARAAGPSAIPSAGPSGGPARTAAGHLSAAQAQRAARTCAWYAAAAGWANNGYYGGSLVTAAAVCVAESGGRPTVYYCEGTGRDGYYPPVTCPGGNYDRGLWQLSSRAQARTADACAFAALCNARAAYLVSVSGLTFVPWAVYGSTVYAQYIGQAQAAVNALKQGQVPGAVLGVCLARKDYAAGAAVVLGACSRAARAQQWAVGGTTIRGGKLCVTAAGKGNGSAVVLQPCAGLPSQDWVPTGTDQLRNPASGRCLHDPGSAKRAGTALNVAACAASRAQTWWLP